MDMDFMAEEKENVVKLWGIPITTLTSLVQSFGIPTLFMIFILYLVWSYLPPVANAHIELLQKTGNTLQEMDKTLKDYNVTIQEFSKLGKETSEFMKNATKAHDDAQQSLDKIESVIIKDKPNVNK